MKYLVLFIFPLLLFADFSASDQGRQIIALQDKPARGLLDHLVSFATQQFDVLRFKKPLTSIRFPVVGLQKEQAEYLQDNTINLSLTCIAGKEVVQRIDKQTSVLTTSRDALGQVTNQSVTNFISSRLFTPSTTYE